MVRDLLKTLPGRPHARRDRIHHALTALAARCLRLAAPFVQGPEAAGPLSARTHSPPIDTTRVFTFPLSPARGAFQRNVCLTALGENPVPAAAADRSVDQQPCANCRPPDELTGSHFDFTIVSVTAVILRTLGSRTYGWLAGERRPPMLSWALGFFIIALIAAFFGFTHVAAGAAAVAQVLFFVFLVLFVIALIAGLIRGRTPPAPPV